MKTMVIIQTSPVSMNELNSLCKEIIPDVNIINMIDDSLLDEVKKNNGLTSAIISRMCSYVQIADTHKPDLVFNQCSSVGEAFDIASNLTSSKTLRIDWPMAQEAVKIGSRIAVVATVSSTVLPSVNIIKKAAKEINKDVVVNDYLVANALDILMKEKNVEKHNQLVLKEINKAMTTNDVVVLAQGSMTTLLPYLKETIKPVLSSPRLAIERAAELLK